MRHLLIFFALCVSACNLSLQTTPPTPTPVPTPTPHFRAPSIVPSVTTGWATYTDSNVGFSLDYPMSWYVMGDHNPNTNSYVIIFSALNPNNPFATEGVQGGKVDVIIEAAGVTFEDLYPSNVESQSEDIVLDEQERTLSDGTPALYTHIRGRFEYEIYVLVTTINERLITIISYEDGEILEQMAASLRRVP
jgi:hypothetical protein